MTNKHGDFIWYELMTTDADAAATFYEAILPWTVGNQPDYREIVATEGHVGGMLPLTKDMTDHGARPQWVGYINVDDVDKMVESVEHGGGKDYMPARDMPGIGRFAMVADPQGAAFYVMKPIPPANDPEATSNAFAAERPMDGHCAWNELATSDPAGALHFYGVRFGWVKDGEMEMGPAGAYHFLRHGPMIGGVMAKVAEMPVSAWTHYFRVADIDAAAAGVKANGGTIIMGPVPVAGSDFALTAIDPQGAHFALVGKKGT